MSEIRQRWRLVVARAEAARDRPHRDVQEAWEAALDATSLPFVERERARLKGRLAFAAPVPIGMTAERELLDLSLAERMTRMAVRQALLAAMPADHALIDVFDVWPGEPTLAGQVVAADYRATIAGQLETEYQIGIPGDDDLIAAAATLLTSRTIERSREKGRGPLRIDIRPHILGLGVERRTEPDSGPIVKMRLRLGGDRGGGRPDEVIDALAAQVGAPFRASIVRQRVILASDIDEADR